MTQRGNNRQQVFYSVEDRGLYLDLLTRHARRYGTQIAGYCLMTNHVHLVVVPEHENSLARTFGRTHAEYAQALNPPRNAAGIYGRAASSPVRWMPRIGRTPCVMSNSIRCAPGSP
jgi:putative transposase